MLFCIIHCQCQAVSGVEWFDFSQQRWAGGRPGASPPAVAPTVNAAAALATCQHNLELISDKEVEIYQAAIVCVNYPLKILSPFSIAACMNLTYISEDFEVSLKMSINDRVLYSNIYSGEFRWWSEGCDAPRRRGGVC